MDHSYCYFLNGWIDATLKHHKMANAEFHGEVSDMTCEEKGLTMVPFVQDTDTIY